MKLFKTVLMALFAICYLLVSFSMIPFIIYIIIHFIIKFW